VSKNLLTTAFNVGVEAERNRVLAILTEVETALPDMRTDPAEKAAALGTIRGLRTRVLKGDK
jgi:hypothetical protein